ncbi:MAG: hypothetical protein WC957_03585 [Candidatus Neomarinimicrobiota bacterium]|jgi:hypothetical protein
MEDNLPERILIGGAPGSGKTYAWLTIARMLPDAKFYVIDPDDGVRRVWYNEFPDVTNIEYYLTPKWFAKDYESFKKKPVIEKLPGSRLNIYKSGVADSWKAIKPKLKLGDWLIVEHLHLLWTSVQDAYSNESFDQSIGNFFLERRKESLAGVKKSEKSNEWQNWTVIKGLHNSDFINSACFDHPAHVFMTTSLSLNDGGKEDIEISSFYGDTKLRYEGEKHNPFRVQTHLTTKSTGRGDKRTYYLNTLIKDRGRSHLVDMPWDDFYVDYLMAVGGW